METMLAGHYQIVRHLGGGGFGQTFLAKDTHLPGSPICVVKQLKPRLTDQGTLETAKRLFDREAETLYRLGIHDQIPRLLAHFEQDKEFYLVQEFIDGKPLDLELLPGKQLNEAATIDLMQNILQVLTFVHEQKVIHRDIKPANLIRRSKDGKVVLIDFGAVKEVNKSTSSLDGQTSMTVAIGSPGYMPIEQQSFRPHFSSDIYAVGIVCIRALTGLRPHMLPRDPQTDEFFCALLEDHVSISSGLAKILDRMVRYDYRQRYETATEAMQALQQLLGHEVEVTQSLLPSRQFSEVTMTATLPSPSFHQEVEQSQRSTQFQDLPIELRKPLEQLLAGAIGPIASLILKRSLAQASTAQALIDLLSIHIPEENQAQFRQQAKRLLKDVDSQITLQQHQPSKSFAAQSSTVSPDAELDPNFVKRCEQELAKTIGPIAPLIVKQTLSKQPNLSATQLVDTLIQHLPSSEKADDFRKGVRG